MKKRRQAKNKNTGLRLLLDLMPFTKFNLELDFGCDFRCSFCSAWKTIQNENSKNKKIVELIKDNTFFNEFPKKQKVHILGGDPFQNKDLLYILEFFKKNKIKINIWIPSIENIDTLSSIVKYIDRFFLFLPIPDPTLYRILTGSDSWERFMSAVQLLKSEKKKVVFSYPVLPDTIQYLPEAYELAWQYKMPLIIHYFPHQFSAESIRYLKRYKLVRNVLVFKNTKKTPLNQCPAFPYKSINSYYQLAANLYNEIINTIRPKLKL
ncbi:radical SAM protein [Candidatus Margulisiibacteriota bacterium]